MHCKERACGLFLNGKIASLLFAVNLAVCSVAAHGYAANGADSNGTAATVNQPSVAEATATESRTSAPTDMDNAVPAQSKAPVGDKKAGLGAQLKEEVDIVGLDPSEIAARSEQAEGDLASFEERLAVPPEVSALRETLHRQEPELSQFIKSAREQVARDAGWLITADVRFELSQRLMELRIQLAPVEEFRAETASIAESVDTLTKEWQRTLANLKEVNAKHAILRSAEQVVKRARVVEIRLQRAQTAVALVSGQVGRMRAMINEVSGLTFTGGPSLIRDFGVQQNSPLFATRPSWPSIGAALKRAQGQALRAAGQFARAAAGPLLLQFLLFIALLIFARRGHSPKGERLTVMEQGLIFRRPTAASALTALLLSLVLYPHAPASVVLLLITLCFLAAIFLLLDVDTRYNRIFAFGGLVLIGFLYAHMVLVDLPDARRLLYGAEGTAVFFFAFLMTRFGRDRWAHHSGKMLAIISRLSLSASGLGLVLWVFGFDIACAILIDGTARLMLLTVVFRVSYDIVTSFARSLVQASAAQHSRMLRLNGALVIDRFALFLRWGLMILWAATALGVYTLRTPVIETLKIIVDKKLEVGSLKVTLGDGLALCIGVFAAVYASRLIRFVLEEEVLPRTGLRLGSRAAVTASTGYVVLGVGLFMALAAIGFELDKITIVVSALGVGIGFGLQNIVQNFVAGIILIFGRPINVGDRVEVGGLLGTVTDIGFRASIIKTIQGAEVIVPNSQFVADQVINWSLSDDHRRIEVDVGVKYGTDPEQVIDLLATAAAGHPDVLAEPKPQALFMGFGASALDFQLQAWTAKGSTWTKIRSELTVTVNRLLAEAQIEIPFPQQDLNLRTVDASVLEKLEKAGRRVTEKQGELPTPSDKG